MKVFISWSGPVSQQIAQAFREWLPLVLPAIEPFITTTDIDKGARWLGEISQELEASNFGIVCLTAQNLHSQWLAFEAGALSKQLAGRVATVLCGVGHNEVQQPLSMFQGTLFNDQDVRQLLLSINAAAPASERREENQIEQLFPILWPKLSEPVNLIIAAAAQTVGGEPQGPTAEEMAAEMLALLRQQNSVLSSPERFLSPVTDRLDQLSMSQQDISRVRDWQAGSLSVVKQRARPWHSSTTNRRSPEPDEDGQPEQGDTPSI